MPHDVFITGATGYIGRPLVAALAARGHAVRALVRPGAAGKLPPGTVVVEGNALEASGWSGKVAPSDTLVHLVGTPHPSPAKAAEFARVDLPSIRAAVEASSAAGISHLVYVSVAHPSPIMQAYIDVRMEGERLVRASAIAATIVRPFYVLGPGHWWPYALVHAVEHPPEGVKVLDVPDIRAARLGRD